MVLDQTAPKGVHSVCIHDQKESVVSLNICSKQNKQTIFSGQKYLKGAQWLSDRVLDLRQRACGFEPHRCRCIMSWSKNINPSLELVQPRKTRPFITERFLMGCKESNQNKNN